MKEMDIKWGGGRFWTWHVSLLGLMRPEMGDNRTTCTVIDGLKLICHTHLIFFKLDNFQFGQFVHRGEKHFLSRVLDVRVVKQMQMFFVFLGGGSIFTCTEVIGHCSYYAKMHWIKTFPSTLYLCNVCCLLQYLVGIVLHLCQCFLLPNLALILSGHILSTCSE